MIGLRGYQQECIDYVHKAWDNGTARVPSVLATGAGKTVIFTHPLFLDRFLGAGQRVLIVAHTDELCCQAAEKARRANPGRTVGIVKANQNEVHAQIIVGSVQTLRSAKRLAQLRRVGLIIIDECHHSTATSYRTVLDHFGAFDGRVKVAGFTATMSRGDKAKLSAVWEEPAVGVFRRDILYMIRHGFLLDVRGERVIVPDLTMSNVKKSGGDFQDASLAEELERTFAPQIVAEKYANVARLPGGELRQGIAFWPLVETAYHGAEAFETQGITSAVVHGGLPKEERRLILKRFAAGEITVVHNCMVLTEGFDAPWADVVVIGRPTRNGGLYQQMVGRVLRPDLTIPAEQRQKALILDVTGAGANNDLRCLVDLSPERMTGVEYEDGDSLLELDELIDEHCGGEAPSLPEVVYVGPAETVAFDPLHRKSVWGQTPDGTFYMGAGSDGFVFLCEAVYAQAGTWDVIWCSKVDWNTPPQTFEPTQHRGLELEEALLWAEEEAIERGGRGAKTLAQRNSPWRRGEPSEKLKNKARAVGAKYTEGMTMGELTDAVNARIAGKSIDPLIRRVLGAGK